MKTNIPGLPETYHEETYGKLTYGLYIPENYDPAQSYPLIIHLHGYSYLESDNLVWYSREVQDKHPCFVYTPKTPPEWGNWSVGDQETDPMRVTLEVLDSIIEQYSIDECRIYVYGISMGGYGIFYLLAKYPDKFAAGMSVCGGGYPQWAEAIAQTPFWMFHGSLDESVPVALTEDVYAALVDMGATQMRYINYPNSGHDIWNLTDKEPAWSEWIFAHSKCDHTCPLPEGDITLEYAEVESGIRLTWNNIRNPDERTNQIWYYKIFSDDVEIGTAEFDETFFDISAEDAYGHTFSVSAVNYCFGESAKSNPIELKSAE